MYWDNKFCLKQVKSWADTFFSAPSKIENNELHFMVSNKCFKTYKEDLGDILIIKIKDFYEKHDVLYFTTTVEKDNKEIFNRNYVYKLNCDRGADNPVWTKMIEDLAKENIIIRDEIDICEEHCLPSINIKVNINDRIIMHTLKDVFNDFSLEELDKMINDICNEEPGFWFNIDCLTMNSPSFANILVISTTEISYAENFECHFFELKDKLIEIRQTLENLNICKKKGE